MENHSRIRQLIFSIINICAVLVLLLPLLNSAKADDDSGDGSNNSQDDTGVNSDPQSYDRDWSTASIMSDQKKYVSFGYTDGGVEADPTPHKAHPRGSGAGYD